jgi:phosphate transport system substrate-binding protein
MASWICDGTPRDGKPHPEQNPAGPHQPYENYGAECAICHLPKSAIAKSGKPLAAAIAVAATGLLTILGAGAALFIWQRYSSVIEPDQSTAPPAPIVPNSSTAVAPPIGTGGGGLYSTLADVPNVPKLTVRYGGSTSFAPLRSPAVVSKIQQAHPGFNLVYTEPSSGKPGSGNGIKMLIDGQLSIAQSSRGLTDAEIARGKDRGVALDQTAVAIDGIGIYVNPQLSIPGLTVAQVQGIYTGKITNWNQVGGPNLKITPFSRDPQDSGTAEFFIETALRNQPLVAAQPYTQDTTSTIRKVASTPGGISYATASEICNQRTIRILGIAKGSSQDFVPACNNQQVNTSAFTSDAYPLTRRLFVISKRDGGLDQQAGVAYTSLLLSNEGQQIMREAGLAPIR